MSLAQKISPRLTLLTVSYRSEALVERNVRLLNRLNPGVAVKWVIVNQEGHAMKRLSDDSWWPEGTRLEIVEGAPPFKSPWDEGSYHHAAGLTMGLTRVKTRFLTVVDPDFYFIRPDWIETVLAHMEREKLAFFGATWNPMNNSKYRGFPCVHGMIVDLEQVPAALLDFTPDLARTERRRKWADSLVDWKRGVPGSSRLLWFFDLAQFLALSGQARDTGHRIFANFGGKSASPLKFEPIQFALRQDHIEPALKFLGRFPRPIDRWLRRGRCPVPAKNKGDRASFLRPVLKKKYGTLRWDEFLWQGEPFAFHLRRVARANHETDPRPYGSEEEAELWDWVMDQWWNRSQEITP